MIAKLVSWLRRRKRQKYIEGLVARGLKLGNNVHIVDQCFWDAAHCYLIQIDDNVTIAPNVTFLAHDASTKEFLNYTKLGKVHVKENSFIGHSAIIMPGVTVGKNTIIGSGSVVTKDIPDGVIAAGNPARIITTLESYLEKVKADVSENNKTIFGQDYHIYNLDDKKRAELVKSATGTTGYID